jgi:hypothetical protein
MQVDYNGYIWKRGYLRPVRNADSDVALLTSLRNGKNSASQSLIDLICHLQSRQIGPTF